MTRIGIPDVAIEGRDAIGKALQETLVDLIALSLNGKQAHWHVTGNHFVSVHQQLDALVTDCRLWADLAAERAITLGLKVDGRPEAVSAGTAVEPFPDGFVDGGKTVGLMVGELEEAIRRMRAHLGELGEHDLVTQGIAIDIVQGLEKHLWMFQAQLG